MVETDLFDIFILFDLSALFDIFYFYNSFID